MTDEADAVRAVLEQRGPIDPAELSRSLEALGVALDDATLDRISAAVGAGSIVGPGGRPLIGLLVEPAGSGSEAASESAGPAAVGGSGADIAEDQVPIRAMLAEVSPWVLVGLLLVVLLLAAVLLAQLNHGLRIGPTITFRPLG